MASISRLPTGKYLANVRRKTPAGKISKSKTFIAKSDAKAWARKVESEIERSSYIDCTEAQQTLFSAVLDRYAEKVAITHRGWSQEQSRCRGLSERLGNRVLTEITPAVLAEYREGRLGQVSPKTIREELSLVQRVFNVCLKDWGISLPSNANPVDLVRKPRGDNPRERRLSPEEYEIVSQIPIFNWAIETAMRRGEIAAMDWRHVDLTKRSVKLPVTKNGSSRTIPLSTVAMTILTQLLGEKEQPVTR